jgi:hypothetical protein
LLLAGGTTAIAIIHSRNRLTEKMPHYNEETGQYELIEDYLGHIEKYKTSDKNKALSEISLYSEEEILFDITGCVMFGRDVNYYDTFNARSYANTDVLLTVYPTTAIRNREDESVYFTYETNTGARLYLIASEEFNYMFLRGVPLVIDQVQTYSEFEKLKKGDSIDEVANIDRIAKLLKTHYTVENEYIPTLKWYISEGVYPTSLHYLDKGILKIEYDCNDTGALFIENIVYSEDYILESYDGTKVNYKINELDLPDSWNDVKLDTEPEDTESPDVSQTPETAPASPESSDSGG